MDREGRDILRKRPRESLLAADLLAADETVDCDCDGAVDVSCVAVLAQTHLRECLGDTHDGFEVANLGIVSDLCEERNEAMKGRGGSTVMG
jgi:hypothetical protein